MSPHREPGAPLPPFEEHAARYRRALKYTRSCVKDVAELKQKLARAEERQRAAEHDLGIATRQLIEAVAPIQRDENGDIL